MSTPSHVDIAFPATGTTVPLDHGYALYGAMSRNLPLLHERTDWGAHPIRGQRAEPGVLLLVARGPHRSAVKLRIPTDLIPSTLALVGRTLELDGHRVTIGAPVIHPLEPSEQLRARFVTIKGFHEDPEPFGDALRRQIETIPGLGQPSGSIGCTVGPRRVQRIKDRIVVGFAVRLDALEAASSIAVQIAGLGGRRRMGAGVFVPPARTDR